jgi:hypothetical protein
MDVSNLDIVSHTERDALWRARLILQTLARTHGLGWDDDEGLLFRMAMGEKDEDQN